MSTPGAGRPVRRGGRVRYLLAGLALLPVVEIGVAVVVARRIGVGWTIVALVALSVVGAVVLRRAGRAAVVALSPRVVDPAAPAPSGASRARGADLALEAAGGVLLALPGFVTAVLGALLVVPPVRRLLRPLLGAAATGLVSSALRRGRVVPGRAEVRVVELRDLDAEPGPSTDRPAITGEVVDPEE